MNRFKKGNALVLTTMILFAVSIIAAGLTMYFYYAAIQNRNSNLYYEKHVELENEFNKTYEILVKNGTILQPDNTDVSIASEAYSLSSTNFFTFKNNGYTNTFEYVSTEGEEVVFTHTVETSKAMNSGRNREYKLVKTMSVKFDVTYTFKILMEDYYVTAL